MSRAMAEPDESLGFEALMREIDRLTSLLERGEVPLEEALAAFERGMALSRRASSMLAQAEARLTRLMEGERGEIHEAPLELSKDDA